MQHLVRSLTDTADTATQKDPIKTPTLIDLLTDKDNWKAKPFHALTGEQYFFKQNRSYKKIGTFSGPFLFTVKYLPSMLT